MAATMASIGSAQETIATVARRPPPPHDPKLQSTDDLTYHYGSGPQNCESARRYLEDVVEEARKTEDAYLIAVLRLGQADRAGVNETRRRNVDNFLKNFYGGRYVVADGGRVKGLGRIELYVNGKLNFVLGLSKNNKDICD